MTTLRAVICDDEPLAVERLARMVEGLSDVEVVQSFTSGEDLLAQFEGGADLLLLDVDMPKLDGFDVVEALLRRNSSDSGDEPFIIFVTAHSKFAVDAFDSGAIDFLTKPVRLGRLERSVERARLAIENRQAGQRLAEVAEQLGTLKHLHAHADVESHVWLRKGSELKRVDVSTIDWISAEGECVRFYSGDDSYLERLSITAIAQRLSRLGFVRIHRSTVVNADKIVSVTRTRWGSLQVRLRTGTELRVSKSFQSALRRVTGLSSQSSTHGTSPEAR